MLKENQNHIIVGPLLFVIFGYALHLAVPKKHFPK